MKSIEKLQKTFAKSKSGERIGLKRTQRFIQRPISEFYILELKAKDLKAFQKKNSFADKTFKSQCELS